MSHVIRLKDLKMRYKAEGAYVLNGVVLEVLPGQIIGYIGPNGAGKSTTVKIMLGMVDQYEGTVEIFGEDINGTKGKNYFPIETSTPYLSNGPS